MPAKRKSPYESSDSAHIVNAAKPFAAVIAGAVRKEIEDFRIAHLTDAQMAELDITIRNAIYTGVYAMLAATYDKNAQRYVESITQFNPENQAEAQFTPSFWAIVESASRR